ncbi:MAG: pseudouridine-5'-phosphate glycosidase [Alkalispirochaeta sp.]
MDSQPRNLQISGDVREALAAGRAVVALESTIISHGMPYPRNVETAREVEEVVRSRGGVPATVAIFDGAFHVGLRDEEIERLGREEGVMKVSRRDLGIVLATHRTGATTVATTMIGAHLAGIRLFATGGTGGVHRGYQETLDVSADLPELGRTPVAVVSAGVKSILDIPRTLEYLETLGVPVITYRSDEFPAFYSRESGLPAPLRLDSPESVAATLAAHWSIPSAGGALIANPIPPEDAIAYGEIEGIIERAVAEAEERGIRGKDLTPFLLGRIVELSGGRSLAANIALVKHNARIATEIAVALARLQ